MIGNHMPTWKKPRKKSVPRKPVSDLVAFPDPRLFETSPSSFSLSLDDEKLGRAQDLVYDAWEANDGRSRYALARRALKLSVLCADAWLILAERPSLSDAEQKELLQRAVAAGELALGEDGFEEYAGHFWGFIETRPYMRARHCLAQVQWDSGNHEGAISHLRDMLVLNPNDNQGLRYILLAWLLGVGDDAAVDNLLLEHDDEASAFMSYTRALMAFRKTGDTKRSREFVEEAWRCNQYVPELLARVKPVKYVDTGYYSPGGEDEAAYYIEEYGFAWRQTSGAITWLKNVSASLPRRI